MSISSRVVQAPGALLRSASPLSAATPTAVRPDRQSSSSAVREPGPVSLFQHWRNAERQPAEDSAFLQCSHAALAVRELCAPTACRSKRSPGDLEGEQRLAGGMASPRSPDYTQLPAHECQPASVGEPMSLSTRQTRASIVHRRGLRNPSASTVMRLSLIVQASLGRIVSGCFDQDRSRRSRLQLLWLFTLPGLLSRTCRQTHCPTNRSRTAAAIVGILLWADCAAIIPALACLRKAITDAKRAFSCH